MTGDTAIQSESNVGDMSQGEGVQALGEGKIDMTETSEEQQKQSEEQDRYDRIKEKYGNDTDKIIKAYDEAQRKISELSTNVPQAPDNYEFDMSHIENLPEDFMLDESDPLLAEMLPVFKENNITGKAANELATKFIEYSLANTPDLDQEMTKLGSEGPQIIERLESFAQKLEPSEQETFEAMTATADQTKLLYKLVAQRGELETPENVDKDPGKSAQEYRDEANEYKKKHAKTISGNKAQQEHYNSLMIKAVQADERDKQK
jgi:hypothetical protein